MSTEIVFWYTILQNWCCSLGSLLCQGVQVYQLHNLLFMSWRPSVKYWSLRTISPLSYLRLRIFSFHSSLLGRGVSVERCRVSVFNARWRFASHMSWGNVLPSVWTIWPWKKANNNCIMSSRRWREVRGNMFSCTVFQGLAHPLHNTAEFVS